MTISPPQNRVTYWEGKIRGIQDARLLADGLMPRGAGKPAGYPNNAGTCAVASAAERQ